jgi:hypothetical protein
MAQVIYNKKFPLPKQNVYLVFYKWNVFLFFVEMELEP